MKNVFVADSPAQAHLVAGFLEEQGVRCVVDGEMLFGVRADIGMNASSLPRVCVRDEDAARAAQIIGVHERNRAEEARDEDEDAAPHPRRGWDTARMLMLWSLIPAGLATVNGTAALFASALLAVAIYVHMMSPSR